MREKAYSEWDFEYNEIRFAANMAGCGTNEQSLKIIGMDTMKN